MIRRCCFLLTIVMMTGCPAINAANFKKSEYSGIGGKKVALILYQDHSQSSTENETLFKEIDKDDDLTGLLIKECGLQPKEQPQMAFGPVSLIPVFATLGKVAFDLLMDEGIRKVEGLKNASQVSYSARSFITASDFTKTKCALILRYQEDSKGKVKIDQSTLVKIENQKPSKTFVIKPFYIRARNALAVTKAVEKDENATKKGGEDAYPQIDVSIALSTKVLGKDQTTVTRLLPAGEGVVTVPDVNLAPEQDQKIKKEKNKVATEDVQKENQAFKCELNKCPSSDLIPLPDEISKDYISMTFSITETGQLGFDVDQASGELKALKEAIGPALAEAIKTKLTPDPVK